MTDGVDQSAKGARISQKTGGRHSPAAVAHIRSVMGAKASTAGHTTCPRPDSPRRQAVHPTPVTHLRSVLGATASTAGCATARDLASSRLREKVAASDSTRWGGGRRWRGRERAGRRGVALEGEVTPGIRATGCG